MPTNVRVAPDLGDELMLVIGRLEALLGCIAVWEVEDDVGLPAPFADRKVLAGRAADRARRGAVVRPNPRTRRTAARSAVTAHPVRVMPTESGRVTIARSAFSRGVELTSPAQKPEGSHGG